MASPEAKLSALAGLQANLDEAFRGRPATSVFLALTDAADRYAIPQEYFSEIIRGVESDLVKTRYQDFDELREYCYRVASVVGLVCLQIFQYPPRDGDAAREYAVDLGLAMQLTNTFSCSSATWGDIHPKTSNIGQFQSCRKENVGMHTKKAKGCQTLGLS